MSGSTAMNARKNRARERDARQNPVDVLGGALVRADTRDEPARLLHVVGKIHRIQHDRGVKVREKDDDQRIQRDSRPRARRDSHSEIACKNVTLGNNAAIVPGNMINDCAKMIGITPAMFTREGDVARLPPVHAPPDHALGVLHRNASLALRHER